MGIAAPQFNRMETTMTKSKVAAVALTALTLAGSLVEDPPRHIPVWAGHFIQNLTIERTPVTCASGYRMPVPLGCQIDVYTG